MICKTIVLSCPVEAAFRLFSDRIDEWWPPERRHVRGPSVISLDARRFEERGENGEVVPLGVVRAWDPPTRILLDWYPGTDPNHPTVVEVRFLPDRDGTRLELRHRAGPNSEDLFPARMPRYEVSWSLVLGALERFCEAGGDPPPGP
ncbi:MAG: SRPBCC domain-containing protein [bacterium]